MVSKGFLNQFYRLKNRVDRQIELYFKNMPPLLPVKKYGAIRQQLSLIKHACFSNGKRIRPIVALMAYSAVGGKNQKIALQSVIPLEFFHNYTLIHDDIYDEDSSRRGVATNHTILEKLFLKKHPREKTGSFLYKDPAKRFGVVAGFINGKILHLLSFLALNRLPIAEKQKNAGIKMLLKQSVYDNVGQVIDLCQEKNDSITEKDYFDMAYYKTGCLLKTSIEWGAYLGGATDKQLKYLSLYMQELGWVFQIKDDLLDIGYGGIKGREVGSDIKKGKKTLPIIYAYKKSNSIERKGILKILGNQMATDKEVAAVINLIRKKGAPEYCALIAKDKFLKSLVCLDKIKTSLKRGGYLFFKDLAYFMWERKK